MEVWTESGYLSRPTHPRLCWIYLNGNNCILIEIPGKCAPVFHFKLPQRWCKRWLVTERVVKHWWTSVVSVYCHIIYIAGTLGCVFIDNETQESGVTKCTTGEAWSAFSWHRSSVFHCQWTHNQVFLLLSHMLIWNAKKYIHLCDEICAWFHLKVGN